MAKHLPADDLIAVAVDVDGTLLNPDHEVTLGTVEAIEHVRGAGILVFLTTARNPAGLEAIQNRLHLRHEWVVACQGAVVTRRSEIGEWEILTEARIDSYQALAIEERAIAMGLSVGRYCGNRWFVRRVDDCIEHEAVITGVIPEIISGDLLSPQFAPHKIQVLVSTRGGQDAGSLGRLARSLPFNLSRSFSHGNMLEITSYGIDKAAGLRRLLESLGIPSGNVAAIGDGNNDITMLKSVGYSFAMGNSSPEVQAAANWVVPSNANDGVSWALHQLVP